MRRNCGREHAFYPPALIEIKEAFRRCLSPRSSSRVQQSYLSPLFILLASPSSHPPRVLDLMRTERGHFYPQNCLRVILGLYKFKFKRASWPPLRTRRRRSAGSILSEIHGEEVPERKFDRALFNIPTVLSSRYRRTGTSRGNRRRYRASDVSFLRPSPIPLTEKWV